MVADAPGLMDIARYVDRNADLEFHTHDSAAP